MFKGLAAAFVAVIVVLASLGITLGALLGNTEIFNPTQAEIDYEQAQVAIEAQEAASALELDHRATVYAEEQAFLERQHEQQLRQQQRAAEQTMAMTKAGQIVLLGTGSGAIFVLAAAGTYYLYACGRARLLQAPRERDRHAEGPRRERKTADAILTQPVTTKDEWVSPFIQYSRGGNGRKSYTQ
jgi:hypothetical protein